MLSGGTALAAPPADPPPAPDRANWIRVSCTQYGSLVYSDEKSADDVTANSDWRETVSRSFPKALCVTAKRFGAVDPRYKPFGTLPAVLPPPEPPPPEPVAPAAAPAPAARPSHAEKAPASLPLQAPGNPGAPIDDASLRAALSAIGMSRGKPVQSGPSIQPIPVAVPPSVGVRPSGEPSAPVTEPPPSAKAASSQQIPFDRIVFADGQDYATGGFIVSDELPSERKGAGSRTVLAGMVFAEPGQASGFADPGMSTGGVMIAEVAPVVRIDALAAAAALPAEPAPKVETARSGSVMVQIASFAGWERTRMQGVWRHLSIKTAALAGMDPKIVKVGTSRVYTALRIGPFEAPAAKDLARSLGEQGVEARMLPAGVPALVAMAGEGQN
ncbi:hypothetical protein BHAOGJBA_1270 [Methylobacterium hispanicum]|uniref:SPOR domain-containing protein n=2 Tax=Methylobacterium hispanicum TaxID=270350 RepID=A0AAV4ZIY2_9HYPH|nr:hypothetical protein BHAOGJBA_1270 [Methylobacterium hispanicum]